MVYGRRYWRNEEILRGVIDRGYAKAWRSGHNEVTRRYRYGEPGWFTDVVRLYETDILTLSLCPRIGVPVYDAWINNGGWDTVTTCQHIESALARYKLSWGVARRCKSRDHWEVFYGWPKRMRFPFDRVIGFRVDSEGHILDAKSDLDGMAA